MTPAPRRRFGIADGLILIAATAAGLAASRAIVPDVTPEQIWQALTTTPQGGWTLEIAAAWVAEVGGVLFVPTLGAWTLAALALQARGVRARRRRLRRSGTLACLAASVVVVVAGLGCLAVHVVEALAGGTSGNQTATSGIWVILMGTVQAGAAVLWSWVAMALVGRWRAERSWTDRLGRVLGACWIVLGVIVGYVILKTVWL